MRFSIITVTYNSEQFIKTCLESVANQTYENIEHLIIDGESSDKTLSIIKNFDNEKVKVFSEPDTGIYDAMNKGISLCKGDVVGILNSDDFYANRDVVSNVSKLFLNPKVGICYGDLCYVEPHNINVIKRVWRPGEFSLGLFSKGWCPPHPTFFVRRNIYTENGVFNLNYKIASDQNLMMRFLEVKRIKYKYIPTVLVNMRLGGTTNRSFYNIISQNIEILRSLKEYQLSSNSLVFFFGKLYDRLKQRVIAKLVKK